MEEAKNKEKSYLGFKDREISIEFKKRVSSRINKALAIHYKFRYIDTLYSKSNIKFIKLNDV
jgi:hypothetical protein